MENADSVTISHTRRRYSVVVRRLRYGLDEGGSVVRFPGGSLLESTRKESEAY